MENRQQTEIKKIMERESALKVLNEIKDLIGGVDLAEICDDNSEIRLEDIQDPIQKTLISAIQCGVVFWDEEENCLTQKLIRPVKSGEITADEFKYKHRLNINELKSINAKNELDLFEKVLAQMIARPPQIIGQLTGQDINITMGCLSFFGR